MQYREATAADFKSMATIVPRAFAPDALPLIIPDTAAIREWWYAVYEKAVHARLLVAVEAEVVGVLTMTKGDPIIAGVPLTADHASVLAEALEELQDKRHSGYLIELVGVDRACQGLGTGRRLIQWACEIADQEDEAIFLQTTAAKAYYLRLGLGFEALNSDGTGGSILRRRKSERERELLQDC